LCGGRSRHPHRSSAPHFGGRSNTHHRPIHGHYHAHDGRHHGCGQHPIFCRIIRHARPPRHHRVVNHRRWSRHCAGLGHLHVVDRRGGFVVPRPDRVHPRRSHRRLGARHQPPDVT